MTKTPLPELHATNYMQKFRCIGPACEDHCCQHWQVLVNQASYKKLRRAMDNSPDDRRHFKERMKRNRSGSKTDANFASIVMNPDDAVCPFLNEHKLCEIQARFGEDYLSDTCRTYPRKLNVAIDHQELSGLLSCPEIARLCLLHPGSTDAAAVNRDEVPTKNVKLSIISNNKNNPYVFYLNEIRSIFDQFLSLSDYPLDSRLFFICYLANRTAPFFKQKGQFTEEQLAEQIERMATEEIIHELDRGFQGLDAELKLPMQLINSLLQLKGEGALTPGLFNGVLNTYGLSEHSRQLIEQGENNNVELDIDRVLSSYRQRNETLRKLFGQRFELIFANFCKNHVYSFHYTENSDLLQAMQGLLMKLATAAFLLISHTRLDRFIENGVAAEDQEQANQVFDEVAVEVFYKFSRAMEHDKTLWERIYRETQRSDLVGLALLTQLIQFSFGK